ncbi:glutathione S-transferase [Asticcacaulis sp. BYS171W]|uniref:Glutathione S-transferase n=1 Tax=Asticcacaulis aquaticus TaxID=2984212 RepID=A0ABT5HPF6_9CAUL|nr:glutathione S-transferase [Asticcacaulis aquaticus]MDC7681941.1 glutathione S-transferase [Asticcacaulis aquaticus]
MITVHHLNNSRSQRVLWLLEELGLEYEVVHYERDARMFAPPELKDIHPLGKSPIVVDGEVVVAETGNIVDYILETYGRGQSERIPKSVQRFSESNARSNKNSEHDSDPNGAGCALVPSDPAVRRQMTYWMHYAEGSAMPLLLLKLVASQIPKRVPFLIRPIAKLISGGLERSMVAPGLTAHFAFWESSLEATGWFAGDALTAADIMMSFPLEAAVSRAGADSLPNVTAFLARIHGWDAYKRALERGGDYAYA